METEPIELLMKDILKRYNRRPQNWRVLTDGKGNVLAFSPEVGFRLKLVSINPREYTGVGVKITSTKEMRDVVKDTPSYGFRPLKNVESERLKKALRQKGIVPKRLVQKLLGVMPVPTTELEIKKPRAILTGPVIAHPDLSAISESQRKLETKLKTEAIKLFRKKYPHRAAIYT